MQNFAARGGVILADSTPGIYDGHGKKRQQKLPYITTVDLALHRYRQVQLGGTGGELASSKDGSADETGPIRAQVGVRLKAAALPRVQLTSKGQDYPALTTLRQDGSNYVFGLYKHATAAVLTPDKTEKIEVVLPLSGHVYDISSAEYLGRTGSFACDLAPGIPKIYSILDEEPAGLQVSAPDRLSRGTALEVAIAAGSGPGIFRLELLDPAGHRPRHYAGNYRFASGNGTIPLQSAWNDLPGPWQITVTHINTGRTASRTVLFE